MYKINRGKELFQSAFGLLIGILGIISVIMEWGTAWVLIFLAILSVIEIRTLGQLRCPHCGKYAVSMALWTLIAKKPVRCKKCGETIEYEE